MYALSTSAEGACHLCVPPDPGIQSAARSAGEAAALGAHESAASDACESALSGTTSTEALHTFTLDSGASRCFFRDRTTLEQLPRTVSISLADPSEGPVLATSTIALPCPAVPSGTLSGLYLPSFSTNLVAGSALQDAGVHQFTPAYERVSCRPPARVAPCRTGLSSGTTALVTRQCSAFAACTPGTLVLPPLPPSSAPPCLHCVEGRQRAAPHSSSFPPTEAPLQTLHLDVWGPARVRGQGHERYFLLVVDDYTRCTTVFPLRTKVQYAAHQLNLWPRVSAPETSPTLRWTGEVGDASVFRVWGCRAFVRDTSTDKLSSRAVPCVFLGFVPDAPGWQFYHPTSRRVFPSQDVTFDESVPFYRLFPYRTAPLPPPPPPLFLTPGVPSVDPLPPQGAAPSGVFQVDPVKPVEVAVDSGPARVTERAEPGGTGSRGTETGGAKPGGAETGGAKPGGAGTAGTEPGGAETGGAQPWGTATGGAEPRGAERYSLRRGATGAGGSAGVGAGGPIYAVSGPEPPSPQRLREWHARRCSLRSGASRVRVPPAGGPAAAGGPGATRGSPGAGPAGGAAGAAGGNGPAGGAAGAGPAGGAAGTTGGTGAAGGAAGSGPTWGAAGAARGTGAAGGAEGVGATAGGYGAVSAGGLTERREPESRPASPESPSASPVRAARTGRRVPCQRPPAVPGTHQMALRPSTAPQRVPLPSPSASSLPALADPDSDSLRAASPTVTRLLATAVTDPSFESAAASALSVCPSSVGGECALGTDVLEDGQEEFECFAAAVPHLVAMVPEPEADTDAPDIPTPRSYAEAIAGEYSS
ncbi:unnamed protein product [Closterium sp. NIES-65]|nr:unnamed protein product [Closterium sp. NIES-65]